MTDENRVADRFYRTKETADTIETLQARIAELEGALEEIAAPAAFAMPAEDRVEGMRDIARAALSKTRTET